MSTTKKLLIILGAVIFTLFTSCDNNLSRKNSKITLDFSSLYKKGNTNSRNAIEDIIEEGKDCFVDLSLEGTFTFSDTFNLKEKTSYTINEIPLGSQVKAIVEIYTLENPDDPKTKEVIYSGQSRNYLISESTTQIVVHLNKPKTNIEIDEPNGGNGGNNGQGGNGGGGNQQQEDPTIKIYVRYNASYQGDFWNGDENKSNEPSENDGKTKDTGFYYIQSAVNWIAENGNGNKDYEIILNDYNDTPFDQYIVFGDTTRYHDDNLRYKASSITITSSTPSKTAISSSSSTAILIATNVPVIFKSIKIECQDHSTILEAFDDPNYRQNNRNYNVTLGQGTLFLGDKDNNKQGRAISLVLGSLQVEVTARISNFYLDADGAAVYISDGYFNMYGNSVIEKCKATGSGGAIFLSTGSVSKGATLYDDASIKECEASGNGGAVAVLTGGFRMDSGSITNCKATQGGAIYVTTEYHSSVSCNLDGGEIKENTATSEGSAVYLKKGSYDLEMGMSGNIYIDPENDVVCNGGANIKLTDCLTTTNEKAALISIPSNASSLIITGDESDIQKSYSKFYVRKFLDTNDYYVDETGYIRQFADTNFVTDDIQLGDIVFADNTRVHADKLPYLSKKLRDSIAGIVFYAGGDNDLIGERNLIVGTKTYSGAMDTTQHDNTGYTIFDSTQITNFPTTDLGRYGSIYENRDTTSYVYISGATYSFQKKSGNQVLESTAEYYCVPTKNSVTTILTVIQNNITNGTSSVSNWPLYQKVFEYGKQFPDDSDYKLNTDETKITDNWYIPTIAECILLSQAFENTVFYNTYSSICGEPLNTEYISESVIRNNNYPDHDLYNGYCYAYYYSVNFKSKKIKCDPAYATMYAVPMHVYIPKE